jgi:hypothetical protein
MSATADAQRPRRGVTDRSDRSAAPLVSGVEEPCKFAVAGGSFRRSPLTISSAQKPSSGRYNAGSGPAQRSAQNAGGVIMSTLNHEAMVVPGG